MTPPSLPSSKPHSTAPVLVRVDILERFRRNRWRLIEVKSSVELKEHYLYDVAIQLHVVSGCGLDLSSAALMHLNRDYIYDGKSYDPHKLFVLEGVTRLVRNLGKGIPKLLRAQRKALAQVSPPGVAALEHFEFLADDDCDRRAECAGSLCETLGRRGRIVVYNATFESQRLGDLADWFPEYGDKIAKIQGRLWDLLPFVREHVYHPEFQGSYSLKVVLPALVPDLTYDGMEVGHGGEAGLVWERMIRDGVAAAEWGRPFTDSRHAAARSAGEPATQA